MGVVTTAPYLGEDTKGDIDSCEHIFMWIEKGRATPCNLYIHPLTSSWTLGDKTNARIDGGRYHCTLFGGRH